MTNTALTPSKLSCPLCGSTDVQSETSAGQLSLPFSPVVQYETVANVCQNCGTSGDFLKANDERIAVAKEHASRASVVYMIDRLGADGVTQAYFERALDLPARTLARWKSGECSASGATLLRIVCTYPWVLEVGDADYDPGFASAKVALEGAKVFATHVGLLSTQEHRPQPVAVVNIRVEITHPAQQVVSLLNSSRPVLQGSSPIFQQTAVVAGALQA